jgi:hypothetical protein
MESLAFGYLYALAALAMTFVSFCAIVLVLRQGRKHKLHIGHRHGYIGVALGAAAAAMLPPLLAVCGLSTLQVWQWSSVIIAIGLAAQTWYIIGRLFETTSWQFPTRVWINSTITSFVVVALIANVVGYPTAPSVGPIAIAASWRLVMAIEIFFLTFEELL